MLGASPSPYQRVGAYVSPLTREPLGMHTIKERPVVVDGQIVIRPIMVVALTYDHRLLDGREAVTFLGTSLPFAAAIRRWTETGFLGVDDSQGQGVSRGPEENAAGRVRVRGEG